MLWSQINWNGSYLKETPLIGPLTENNIKFLRVVDKISNLDCFKTWRKQPLNVNQLLMKRNDQAKLVVAENCNKLFIHNFADTFNDLLDCKNKI